MSWTRWKGDLLKRATRQAMGKALVRAGETVKQQVLAEVPHDEGILQATVDVFQNPVDELDVVISAGGGAGTGFPRVPYAIKWHETPANFQKGRKHNYVRDPLNQVGPSEVRRQLQIAGKQTW